MPGEISFGQYVLLERLAAGGMAEVFRAKKLGAAGFEKTVAVKRILPSFSQEKAFVDMFIDEARLASKLTHANIINVDDFGCEQDQYYLAMEFIDGLDLSRLMRMMTARNAKVPLEVATFIMAEIASGLAYAHAQSDEHGQPLGLVHRDVSPQNILLSYAGDVKLADFGIAKAKRKVHVTAVGAVVGKFKYMSPEQVLGQELDGRSDIFSAGAVLFELCTGRPLFDGEGTAALEQIKSIPIPPPSQFNRDVPPMLDHIVQRALARSRDERYATAAEFGKSLRTFLHSVAAGYSSDDLASFINRVAPRPVVVTPVAAAQAAAHDATVAARPPPMDNATALQRPDAGRLDVQQLAEAAAPPAEVLAAALERELADGPAARPIDGPSEMGRPINHRSTGPHTLSGRPPTGSFALDLAAEREARYPPRRSHGGAVAGWIAGLLVLAAAGYFGWRYKDKLMALVGPPPGADAGGPSPATPEPQRPVRPTVKPAATFTVARPRPLWDEATQQAHQRKLLGMKGVQRALSGKADGALGAMLEGLSRAIAVQRVEPNGMAKLDRLQGPIVARLRRERVLAETEALVELWRKGGVVPEEILRAGRNLIASRGAYVPSGKQGHDLTALLAYLSPADPGAQEAYVKAASYEAAWADPAKLGAGETFLNPHLAVRDSAVGRLRRLGPRSPLVVALERYEQAVKRGEEASLASDLKVKFLDGKAPKPGVQAPIVVRLRATNAGTQAASPPWGASRLIGPSGRAREPVKAPTTPPMAPGASVDATLQFEAGELDDTVLILAIPAGPKTVELRIASLPGGEGLQPSAPVYDDDYFR